MSGSGHGSFAYEQTEPENVCKSSLGLSRAPYGHELTDGSRADFEQAIGIVIQRTEQLNSLMRRFADVFRLPPPVKQPDEIVALIENIVRLLGARTDATQIAWRAERGAA